MKIKANEKNIILYLENNNNDNTPIFIKSDSNLIKQVIINLIGNALKFTNEGNIIIRYSINNIDSKNILAVEVEDTGIGINNLYLDKIFEPFFQVNSSDEQKGTGLGLSISKQSVELLNGNIFCQ